MSFDLIVRHATLPDGRKNIDIGIANGAFVAFAGALQGDAAEEIDAAGCLVTPPLTAALGCPLSRRLICPPIFTSGANRLMRWSGSIPQTA